MKIVYLSSSAQPGGVENVLLDLLACVRAAEPEWELLLVVPSEGPIAERARSLGVAVTVLAFPDALARFGDAGAGGPAGRSLSRVGLARRALATAPGALLYARRLRRVLRESAPDIVHANGFKMLALGALAHEQSAPLIWHLHDYVSGRALASGVLRLLARSCAMAVANSQSVADDARVALSGRVVVGQIYNAVDVHRFKPEGESADLDALAGLPQAESTTVRVGLVAALARWKGHETFLRALALLPASLRVRGYVIGDALYKTEGSQHTLAELRRMAARLGVSERVGFTGFVIDAAAAMRALDVVVHASTEPEPFGLVIAEAMACGRAVIASEAGGAAEVFTRGVDALAHTPGDAAELAARIEQLACDATARQRLGDKARQTAERRFDRRRLACEWAKIYRGTLNANQKGRITALSERVTSTSEHVACTSKHVASTGVQVAHTLPDGRVSACALDSQQ